MSAHKMKRLLTFILLHRIQHPLIVKLEEGVDVAAGKDEEKKPILLSDDPLPI